MKTRTVLRRSAGGSLFLLLGALFLAVDNRHLATGLTGITADNALAVVIVASILLVMGSASYIDRELRKGRTSADDLEDHANDLEHQVRDRTAELSALSSHLQNVVEQEKAALARELHDELGGLLVAAKMDVAWLEKRVPTPDDPAILSRWKRIRDMLDQGVDLKRRVVENLRPSLLDTMGLIPALRWVLQETCGRAGLRCTERYPEGELTLTDEASIQLFRLVQEALTNVVKHARASSVALEVLIKGDELVVRVVDDGVGVAAVREHFAGFHGLASMRHRVTSIGGQWALNPAPGRGTEVMARIPLASIRVADPQVQGITRSALMS
jgi:signal transduction histidine kinase